MFRKTHRNTEIGPSKLHTGCIWYREPSISSATKKITYPKSVMDGLTDRHQSKLWFKLICFFSLGLLIL